MVADSISATVSASGTGRWLDRRGDTLPEAGDLLRLCPVPVGQGGAENLLHLDHVETVPRQEAEVIMGTTESDVGTDGGRVTMEMSHILVVLPRCGAVYGSSQSCLEVIPLITFQRFYVSADFSLSASTTRSCKDN